VIRFVHVSPASKLRWITTATADVVPVHVSSTDPGALDVAAKFPGTARLVGTVGTIIATGDAELTPPAFVADTRYRYVAPVVRSTSECVVVAPSVAITAKSPLFVARSSRYPVAPDDAVQSTTTDVGVNCETEMFPGRSGAGVTGATGVTGVVPRDM
jgi:hypothetical protein